MVDSTSSSSVPASSRIQNSEPQLVVVDEIVTASGTTNNNEPSAAAAAVDDANNSSSSTTTMKTLLQQFVPGLLVDEEAGLVAMFQEIHQSMPEPPGKELARATMAELFAVWTRIQQQQQQAASSKAKSAASATTPTPPTAIKEQDDDLSMFAMIREIRDALPKHEAGGSAPPAAAEMDDTAAQNDFMDALLANMLHTYIQAREAASRTAGQVSKLVSPPVTSKSLHVDEEEDITMAGMFKEIASHFSGSEQDAESYMIQRLEQIISDYNDHFPHCGERAPAAAAAAAVPATPEQEEQCIEKDVILMDRSKEEEDGEEHVRSPPVVPSCNRSGTLENPITLISVEERIARIEGRIPVSPTAIVDAVTSSDPNQKETDERIATIAEKIRRQPPTPIIVDEELDEEEKKEDTHERMATPPQQQAESTPTIHDLLHKHVPGILVDEEVGIAAMFREIHETMPEAPGKDKARATMAQVLATLAAVQQSATASLATLTPKKESESGTQTIAVIRNATTTKTLADDEDLSMAAMFREIRDSLPHAPEFESANQYMDALLANMLLKAAQVREDASRTAGQVSGQISELVSPPVTSKTLLFVEEEDVSLAGMFKEIASHFSGSEQQVESHMMSRLERMI